MRDNAGNVAYKTLRRSDFPYPPEPPKPTEPEKPLEPAKPPRPAETVKQPEKGNALKPSKGTKTEKTDAENSQTPPLKTDADVLKGKDSKKKDVSDFTIARIPATKQGDNKTETVSEAQKGNGQRTEDAEAVKTQNESLQNGQNLAAQQTGEYIERALFIAGIALLLVAILLFVRLLWLHSVVLYCYNGGEDYKRLGLLHLKREKGRFFLYLPEYLLESSETPRYRLVLRQALIKRHENAEIVVQSAEHKLRRPVEECVDFVL